MKYLQVCRSLYDYEARTTDEISIKENDTLYIIDKGNDDWWKAELKQVSTDVPATIGLVPATYLEEMCPIGKVQAEYDYEAQQEEELSFGEGEAMWLLERDDPDWYLVKLDNGDIGLAPANYVHNIEQQYDTSSTLLTSPTTTTPSVAPSMHIKQVSTKQNDDEARSWTVHEYDASKKKKKKGKGNLMVGNAMLCYGSETDKACPVQQYSILNVAKYLFDGKTLHIEIDGPNPAVLDLQASSKSEAKAILLKISDSRKAAEVAGTHVSQQPPPETTTSDDIQHTENNASNTTSEPKWAISLYTFEAEGGEEISITENQQILVTDYDRDNGWWRVETTDGLSGVIPSSYVQFYSDTSAALAKTDDDVDTAAHDEVETYMQEREKREQQDALGQTDRQRKMDQQRRDDEERERRRKVQEAAQLAEVMRQRQAEEDRRRRESVPRSSASPSTTSGTSNTRLDLPKPDPDRLRTWTDRSGTFKVEAQFLAYTDGKLRLHKANGVKIDVPLEKMSAEDIRWVERRTDQPVGSTMNVDKTPEMPPRPVSSITSKSGLANAKKTANSNWDWFDWLMTIGIPMQEALVYSSAFKADHLDDSDLTRLTHKQMKMLGMKEKHVQRMERYIDTGKVEPPSDDEDGVAHQDKQTHKKQTETDEEIARRLQASWNSGEGNKESAPSRPKPSVSAPTEVHPDLLEFLGSDLTSSSNNAQPQPTNSSNDLIGFSDDAWALRPTKETSRLQNQPLSQPHKPLTTPNTLTLPSSPADMKPHQSIFSPSTPVAPASQQQTGTPVASTPPASISPQQQSSMPKTIDPSILQRQNTTQQAINSNTRPSLNQLSQQEELRKLQQQQRQQSLLEQQQQIIMQQQQHIQQQQIQQQQIQLQRLSVPTANQQSGNDLGPYYTGMPPPQLTGYTPPQQQQATGYAPQQYQATGYTPQQYQATGYTPQQPTNMMMMMNTTGLPSIAGQLHHAQTLPPQMTGRHWHSATADNPFGSPVNAQPLNPQMTGVQFTTPHPNTFTQSPTQPSTSTYLQQLQPQMTGIQQTELSGTRDKYAAFKTPNADVFTPSGSMQYGQSGFSNPQGY